ncbi:HPP family protein [Acinetobacter wanghuae]|uniref:HPP family protein n=1 Tax=Acinetobacter wanghuae TaxID=2662362 RepID=UPI003AF7DC99
MMFLFEGREKLAKRPSWLDLLRSLIGASLSIALLIMLSHWSGHLWIMAPFGASCVLLYAAAQSPLAQPRNVIFGHLIAATVCLLMLKLFGSNTFSIAFAVGISICAMQYFRCIHPPAGANPLVILLTANTVHYDWSFLIFPVLSGAICLVLIAYWVNNFKNSNAWPHYALALKESKIKD